MKCPFCGGHLRQEGIIGNEDGSIDVQFTCENGHSGWMTIWLDESVKYGVECEHQWIPELKKWAEKTWMPRKLRKWVPELKKWVSTGYITINGGGCAFTWTNTEQR